MPRELKRRLAEEAARRGGNLNDVAVGLLASRFAVPFEPTGRAGAVKGGEGRSVLLRMPPELKRKLSARAAERKRNVNDLIVETLSERLGKDTMTPSKGKEPRADDRVRGATLGVGNCANSLLQGVEYYKDADPQTFVPGLMHVDLGGYTLGGIRCQAP